ncbi:choice-of-anchor M domain-containing protein [Mobiluncus mulieris]|uniref:choice-of-anchor M domain-containing protein n=1 Tax=Mobiluncus mulieris TaxID=2052 RepID=UPI0014702219|nr:choice-of-anchor M domain-containing protein [Mobiluncus mulieris]NMX11276.1 hypothetical protein [Mobiluncus mulieris]
MPKTLLKKTIILTLALSLWSWGTPAYAESSPPDAEPKTTANSPADLQGSSADSNATTETADTTLPIVNGQSADARENSETAENTGRKTAPTPPGENRETTTPTELRQGHMDAFYVTSSADGQLQLRIKEDVTGSGVVRTPESATMMMGENWYVTGLDWHLPGCENSGYSSTQLSGQMLFPGWSSSDFSLDGFSQVKVHFTEVNAPQSGRIALVTQTLNGKTLPVLRQGNFYIAPDTELGISPRGHQHFHWLFTKPGTYQFRAKVVGQREGKTVESPEVTYTWVAEGSPANFDPVGLDPQCQPWIPDPADYPDDDETAPPIIPQGDGKPVLSAGHLDVFYVSAQGDNVQLATKEDVTGSEVIRPAESYYLRIKDNAKVIVPAHLQPQLVAGGYLLEENGAHQRQMLFPGWDTNAVAPKFHSVDLNFEEISGPGKVFLFHNAPGEGKGAKSALKFGGYEITAGKTIHQPFPAHSHVNWLFEKPGVYTMKVSAYVTSSQWDKEEESNTATYTWIVGDKTPLPDDAQTENLGNAGNSGKTDANQGKPGLDLIGKTGKGGGTVPGIKGKKSAKKTPPQVGKIGKKAGKGTNLKPGKKTGKSGSGKAAPKKKGSVAPLANKSTSTPGKTDKPSDASVSETLAPSGFLTENNTAKFPFPEFDSQAERLSDWAADGNSVEIPALSPDSIGFLGQNSDNLPGAASIPDQPGTERPRLAAPVAPREHITATAQSPYGSAVVRNQAGLDPTATFLVGTGIASGLLGFALLASRIPRRFPVLRRN